ncbi:MAG: Hit-like protein involved in cell-cycle regulation [Elusimicrobia bacterium]|nr:MAG: Hit-like protein involved in cell-cycle regulation [Elusimicrobiota bacterium]
MLACIFCKIAAGEVQSQIVHEDDRVLVFKDLNPIAPTHLLVIPRKHIARVSDAGDADESLLGRLQLVIAEVAKKAGLNDFRVVTNNGKGAGQSVDHLHYHVIAGRRMNWPPG